MSRMVSVTVGARYGRLVVVRELPRTGATRRAECKCDCGSMSRPYIFRLVRGETRSCGCVRREDFVRGSTRHGGGRRGAARMPEFTIWLSMRQRCRDPKTACYYRYGGAGVYVCKRWSLFENFMADMGQRPTPKHSIDRVDGSKGYEPGNCRWATAKEQGRNRKNNHRLSFRGQSLTMIEWCEKTGIKLKTLWHRIKVGWSVERALTEPVHKWR